MDAAPAQPTHPTAHRPVFGITSVLWLAFFVLVLYPLSTGPALKLANAGLLSVSTIHGLYKPLELLVQGCRPAQNFFRWYIYDLWKCDFP